MHPSGLVLMILLAAAVTDEVHGAHPAADTPAGRFWEEALAGTPLPEAIADLIQKGIERSPLKERYYSAAYDVLSGVNQKYFMWTANFTRGTVPQGFFFHEEDVARVGSIISVYFPPATTTPILAHDVVEKLPFGSLQDTLDMFDMTSRSAEFVAETLRECQDSSLIPGGEQKECATSLEGTVRAAARMLGATECSGVWAAASALPRAGLPRQRYVVTEVTLLPGEHHVGCHDKTFPYAVYHCHMFAQSERAYVITIQGFDGRPAVAMVAVCHLDTTGWNPGHPVFKILGTQPGGAPVCHFFPYANLLFGKTMMDDTA